MPTTSPSHTEFADNVQVYSPNPGGIGSVNSAQCSLDTHCVNENTKCVQRIDKEKKMLGCSRSGYDGRWILRPIVD